ncbi:hypothetical protein SALBM217S_06815 [Streptomyces griseoloalbus]
MPVGGGRQGTQGIIKSGRRGHLLIPSAPRHLVRRARARVTPATHPAPITDHPPGTSHDSAAGETPPPRGPPAPARPARTSRAGVRILARSRTATASRSAAASSAAASSSAARSTRSAVCARTRSASSRASATISSARRPASHRRDAAAAGGPLTYGTGFRLRLFEQDQGRREFRPEFGGTVHGHTTRCRPAGRRRRPEPCSGSPGNPSRSLLRRAQISLPPSVLGGRAHVAPLRAGPPRARGQARRPHRSIDARLAP